MAISIKTPEEIEKMRVAGRLAAEVLEMIEPFVKPGVSTGELDRICNDYIVNEQHAVSACLGYHGFPKSVCISINEVVCHGIPDDEKLLKDGDIVNIDVTVIKDEYHGDTSKMFIVGKPTILGERLCKVTQDSLYLALKMVKPGIRLRTIGAAIQKFVEAEGFSVVREYCGHGIGRVFHEEPQVLHYDADDGGVVHDRFSQLEAQDLLAVCKLCLASRRRFVHQCEQKQGAGGREGHHAEHRVEQPDEQDVDRHPG